MMSKVLDELLKSPSDIQKMIEELEITPQQKSFFWKQLLKTLKEKENYHTQSELPDADSILGYINEKADFTDNKDTNHSVLLDALIDQTGRNAFWNQSVQTLINRVQSLLIKRTENTKITGTHLYIKDLKNSDAGYSFKSNPWVKPNTNIDNKTYEQIRKKDSVLSILQNKNKLQYTNTQDKKDGVDTKAWLRLLMPQYDRRTEIEDLDRNFWVIAQFLTGLSGYLFDDNAPLPELLKRLIDEVLQLWENILFLWLEAAAISQQKNNKVRVLFPYLPDNKLPTDSSDNKPSTIIHYKKYDNFDQYGNLYNYGSVSEGRTYPEINIKEDKVNDPAFINMLKHYYERYSDENLFIVPIMRLDNYKQNYYSTEIYPIVACRHRKWDDWKVIPLYTYDGHPPIYSLRDCDNLHKNLLSIYTNKVTGVRPEKYGYEYHCPYFYEKTDNNHINYYYGAVRVIPEADIVTTIDGFHINKLSLTAYDAGFDAVIANDPDHEEYGGVLSRRLVTIAMENQDIKASDKDVVSQQTGYKTLTFSKYQPWNVKDLSNISGTRYYFQIAQRNAQAPYFGELITFWENPNYSGEIDIDEYEFKTVKIGDAYPSDCKVSDLIRITDQPGSIYKTEIYGDGSMYSPLSYSSDDLSFFSYEKGTKTNPQVTKRNFSDVNAYSLQVAGATEISRLYLNSSGKFDKNYLCVTKVGLGYWKGGDGSQWSYGILADLFIALQGTNKVEHLGRLNILDGYWNQTTKRMADGSIQESDLYPVFKIVDNSRHRHLSLEPAATSIKKKNGSWYVDKGRWWKWKDVNRNDMIVGECAVQINGDNQITVDANNQTYTLVGETTSRSINSNIMAFQLANFNLSNFSGQTVLEALLSPSGFGGRGTVGVYSIDPKSGSRIFR